MKCDLCGVNVTADKVQSYGDVEGSALCHECFIKLSPDKQETFTLEISSQTQGRDSGDNDPSEPLYKIALNRLTKIKLFIWMATFLVKGRYILVPWALLCLISAFIGFRGLGTEPLISSAYRHDPHITAYNGFYFKKNKIIIDYSVTSESNFRFNYTIPAGNYWAELYLDKTINEDGYYKIHRQPLPTKEIIGFEKLHAIDIGMTPLALDRNLALKSIHIEYAKQNYRDKPIIITYMSAGGSYAVNSIHIYMSYYNNNKNSVEVITREPRSKYMPISQIPKVVIGYPFAVLFDYVTYPVLVLTRRVMG